MSLLLCCEGPIAEAVTREDVVSGRSAEGVYTRRRRPFGLPSSYLRLCVGFTTARSYACRGGGRRDRQQYCSTTALGPRRGGAARPSGKIVESVAASRQVAGQRFRTCGQGAAARAGAPDRGSRPAARNG